MSEHDPRNTPRPDDSDPTPRDPAEIAVRRELSRHALLHYQRGNRFYDSAAWDRALHEWRSASRMWALARVTGRLVARRLMHLRAALALLLTVAVVYAAVFTFFPRAPFELFLLSGGGTFDTRSWWERFLDNGRPQPGDTHKMGMREWWEHFRRSLEGGDGGQVAGRGEGRPGIDRHWEELLRRYGRWGPFFNYELDYNVIAGYGLSRMGDYSRAVDVFQRGIEHTSEPAKLADLYQGLANAHYYQGYRLQPDGLAKYDLYYVRKSTEAYEKSVHYQPRPVSYGNLGWMYFLLGDYARSERYSRRALQMDASLEYVRLNLGLTYLMQNQIYDAFDVYRSVIRRNPSSDVFAGGINDLREVVRDHPGRKPYAYLMIGMLALKEGDYTQARDALSRFNASPLVSQTWRDLARRLLRDMDASEVER
ncbi:MAG TPA: tetratricopeptide repeat protein [bacterium]|nr:tetratricopeptide repeat protein [bacterium]